MIVIIKLHIRVIFRNTFSLHTKQEVIRYPCNNCDYQATTKGNLQTHIQSTHEGIKFPCKECEYQATQQIHLQTHIKLKHKGIRGRCLEI